MEMLVAPLRLVLYQYLAVAAGLPLHVQILEER
jgi:hypothetical protein